MAMYRYGAATVAQASITVDQWTDKVYKDACTDGLCKMRTAKSVIARYSPEKYLLSHCFPAGQLVLMADGTEKPIEQVMVGDLVITHQGNIKPVTQILTREVSEDLIVFQPSALPETVCTAEHPFYAIKKQDSWCKIFPVYAKSETVKCTYGGKQKCNEYNCNTNGATPNWITARDLQVGDKTYTPTLHEISICNELNPNRMRLLGYYVAEGRVDKQHGPNSRPYMIRFSIHEKEVPTLGAEISKLMELEFGIKTHSVLQIKNNHGLTLSFHCFKTALWFLKFAGIGSKTKRLSQEVMVAPLAWQRQFIGAWLNGDGSYDSYIYDSTKGNYSSKGIRLSTVSSNLKSQAMIILDRLEIHSNLQKIHTPERIINGRRVAESNGWHVSIPKSYVMKLSDVVQWDMKVLGCKLISTKQRYRYAASTISTILSVSKKFFTGSVYNLSVEDDESYIINRQAVHNCSIIAAVDVDLADPKNLRSGYLIKPEFSKFVNNNGDAWTKGVIKNSYKTFIGADNFQEHVQIPELSKGKIVDAALREIVVGKDKDGKDLTTLYVDILVATDRKHDDLVRKIESKETNSLSMGCLIKFSICSKCGKQSADETDACEHVRFQKGNTFFDKNGIQRKIGELCGHESEPDSVKFIEASWVRQPAFTGAVLRSFVNPSEEIMAKIEDAEKCTPYKIQKNDWVKAAGSKLSQKPKKEEEPAAEEPTAEEPPPADAPAAEPPPTDAPVTEEPAGDLPPEDDENNFKTWKKDLKKQVLKQISDEVLDDMSQTEPQGPRDLETLDETLIKPASLALHKVWGAQKTWDRFVQQRLGKSLNKADYDKLRYGLHIAMTNSDLTSLKDYGYEKRDFLAVLSFIDSCLRQPLPLEIKKTIAQLAGTKNKNAQEILSELPRKLGRIWTAGEKRRMIAWLKLLDYYPERGSMNISISETAKDVSDVLKKAVEQPAEEAPLNADPAVAPVEEKDQDTILQESIKNNMDKYKKEFEELFPTTQMLISNIEYRGAVTKDKIRVSVDFQAVLLNFDALQVLANKEIGVEATGEKTFRVNNIYLPKIKDPNVKF